MRLTTFCIYEISKLLFYFKCCTLYIYFLKLTYHNLFADIFVVCFLFAVTRIMPGCTVIALDLIQTLLFIFI